jgi:translation initiation factor 5B
MIRQPIIVVIAHVDHGKTTLLDTIRGTAVAASEPGLITQAIGASIIPIDTIKQKCGDLLLQLKLNLTIPGLLFIDTPGHAAFTTLRKRGGAIADLAVVVVDINEGFKPQTLEAIDILRSSKTPFIIAANKIDIIPGWRAEKGKAVLASLEGQNQQTRNDFEIRMYAIVNSLYDRFSMSAERFDRVDDYTKQIAIIPCSAKHGIGLPELLMVLAGLAQKFLEQSLTVDVSGPAHGTILEVKEERGLGKTLDTIIYDGTLRVNDTIVVGSIGTPIVAKVRALFQPAPLSEMRDKHSKFTSVKAVHAATGVKISAPGTEEAIAGMPVRSCRKADADGVTAEIQEEVSASLIQTEKEGIVVKADSLGSLEALAFLLKEKGIPVMKASIGDITKKDIADAEGVVLHNPLLGAVLGFNVKLSEGISAGRIAVFTNAIIYRLLEEFDAWSREQQKAKDADALFGLIRPCKIELLKGYIFRQSNPAVIGTEVLAGTLKVGMPLVKAGQTQTLTAVKSLQQEKESITEAKRGMQIAMAMDDVIIGRQLKEGDMLYSAIPEDHFRRLREHKELLSSDELEAMKEYAAMQRKKNSLWGI